MEVKLPCECLCCLRAREKRQREDRQTQRAKRVIDTEKETVQFKESKLSRENTRKRKGNRKRGAACFASRRSSPQNAHQRTEQNRTYAPRLLFFLAQSPASRFTSPVFLDVRMRTGKASREKRQFLSCSLSILSISHFTLSLSLTAQRRPTVLVSQ